MAYVRAHFATRPTLDQIAAAVGLSTYHFHRRFRLHFGETPLDVIVRLQMEKSQRLQHAARIGECQLSRIGTTFIVGVSAHAAR